jgi:peroxiredoxin Q/BCP
MDGVDKQKAFADKHGFDYPLLSDPDGAVAKAFGVKRSLGFLKVRRVSFVLDEDLRVVEVISSELRTDRHADRALEVLAATPRQHASGA